MELALVGETIPNPGCIAPGLKGPIGVLPSLSIFRSSFRLDFSRLSSTLSSFASLLSFFGIYVSNTESSHERLPQHNYISDKSRLLLKLRQMLSGTSSGAMNEDRGCRAFASFLLIAK